MSFISTLIKILKTASSPTGSFQVSFMQNIQTDIDILNFSKASDTVSHYKITPFSLSKWNAYSIKGSLHSLISSFLCKWQIFMHIVIDGKALQETHGLSDIPQDTVLGTVLFLVTCLLTSSNGHYCWNFADYVAK